VGNKGRIKTLFLIYPDFTAFSILDEIIVIIHIVRMDTLCEQTTQSEGIELGYKAALLIREVNARLNATIASELTDRGLTLPQITLIKALAHGKELTITELARELSTGKSTVVGIVDRLERVGIVERRRGGGDRREVHVAFSPNAQERVMSIKTTVDAAFSKAFAHIPVGELIAFERSMEKILGAMGSPDAETESLTAGETALPVSKGA